MCSPPHTPHKLDSHKLGESSLRLTSKVTAEDVGYQRMIGEKKGDDDYPSDFFVSSFFFMTSVNLSLLFYGYG